MQDAITIAAPDDIALLRRTNDELLRTIQKQRRQIEGLESRLDQLLRRLYGPRSERTHPDQPLLFDEPAEAAPAPPPVTTEPSPSKPRGHGRRKLAKHLRRERIEHDLVEAEKVCVCGTARIRIGEEVSERLAYDGPSYHVVEHVKFKYACRSCKGQHVTASMPAEALPKSSADPSLLAHIIVSKFADHVPLHRHEHILARHGLEISRTTMGDWLAGCAEALRPLYELLCDHVRQSNVIHTDDTPVTMLDRSHPDGRVTGRVWVYHSPQHRCTVFESTPNRKRDGPMTFLKEYKGYLQADAFGGYDGLYAKGVTEVACWAHARRKFHEAQMNFPAESAEALARIGALYDIEKLAKSLTSSDRAALRQRDAAPQLQSFAAWMDSLRANALPKSALGQAITYATNQWNALNVYVTDGDLAIDNNVAERELRGIAVGRKNWNFFGSVNGGRTAAILMSFTATCRQQEIDPWRYLTDVLRRIPNHPADQLEQLRPDLWAQAQLATINSEPR